MFLATNYNVEFTRSLCGAEKYNGHSVGKITILACPIAFIETDVNKLGGLLGGSSRPPGAGRPLSSMESFDASLLTTALFRKALILGFSPFLRVGVYIYMHIYIFNFFFSHFKDILFLIEKERPVAQQSTAKNSAGRNCTPCPGFGGGWPRSPATGPRGREEVARLGSGSEIQLLVPQFLPPWGWDVYEGWLVAFGRCPQREAVGGSTLARHQLPKPHQPSDPSPRSCRSGLLAAKDPQGGSVAEAETFLLLVQCEIIVWIHVRKSSPRSSFGDMTESLLHFCQR